LTVARTLAARGRTVLVAEARDRVGGNIVTAQADGFLWEEGPNSFSPTPELLRLAVDVGLKDKFVFANRQLPRYVYWNGRLQPVPMQPTAAIATSLLSPLGKLRAAAGALGFVAPPMAADETVAAFFTRHLGAEVAERLVAPFVSGVYAGDVRQLSARSAFRRVVQLADVGGGLVAGAILSRRAVRATAASEPPPPNDPDLPQTKRGELGSFVGGLQMLPEAIASELGESVRLRWAMRSLQPTETGYRAEFETPSGVETVEARTVVLAAPADACARLLGDLAPDASRALDEIPYPTVACVVLAYPDAAFAGPLRGFGNLIPRGQGIRTLGTIWTSTLFENRAPEGWRILTNFIGGATDPALAELSADEIVAAVRRDLATVLLARDDIDPKVLAVNIWRRAIPQYTLNHDDRLTRIRADLERLPGLHLCSNFTDGVALGDCVRRGRATAEAIAEELEQPAPANASAAQP